MSHRAGLGLLFAAIVVTGSCDRDTSVPDNLLREQPEDTAQPAAPPRPTTQELLEGPRVPMVLDSLPVAMLVPPQWRITRPGGSIVWLEGPTPHGEARIALRNQPPIPLDQFHMYLKGSRRDQEEEKNTTINIRQVGPMHIVERRTILQSVSAPIIDSQGIARLDARGEMVMMTTVPMRWWINLFVPSDQHVEQYDLSFLETTKEQFDVDGPFLEKMLSTLKYIGPQPATAPSDRSTNPAAR